MVYDSLPSPCSDLTKVLHSNKNSKIETEIEDGTKVRLRLDIPAFNEHGVWVVTVHDQKWTVLKYCNIAKIKFAKMTVRQNESLNIYHGISSKSPMAAISGEWLCASEYSMIREAQNLLDQGCTQVGFNPHKHSFFYDRMTELPIVSADEVLQIGGLIFALKPKYGKLEDFLY